MKLARPALALGLGLAVALTGQSHAAAKKPAPLPCKLITDAADDATLTGAAGNDTSLDILSFDMASTDKKMTVVWRVKKASFKSAVLPAGGIEWNSAFTWQGRKLQASVASNGTKATGIFSEEAAGNNDVISFTDAKVDLAKNEVRMTIPASDFPERFKLGAVFSAISASSTNGVLVLESPVVNGSGGGLWGDDATKAGATYKAGAKNCVVVGK